MKWRGLSDTHCRDGITIRPIGLSARLSRCRQGLRDLTQVDPTTDGDKWEPAARFTLRLPYGEGNCSNTNMPPAARRAKRTSISLSERSRERRGVPNGHATSDAQSVVALQ